MGEEEEEEKGIILVVVLESGSLYVASVFPYSLHVSPLSSQLPGECL